MSDEILLLSDMHTFSHWALLHPEYIGVDKRTGLQEVQYIPNSIQKYTFGLWEHMARTCKNVDSIIINGDVIDGNHRKNRGAVGNDIFTEQCNMAVMLLEMLPEEIPMYIIKGTNFHCGEDPIAEETIAAALGARYADEGIIETCGIRIFANHHIAHSQYKAGALERKIIQVAAAERYYGKIDVILRAHNHQFMSVVSREHVAVMTPGWQHKTKYAVDKDLITPPDIGYVKLIIEDNELIHVDRRGVSVSPFGPQVL